MKRIATAIAIVATMLAAPSAIAGTLTEFNAAVESAAVHYRAALNDLRAGDSTRAAVQIARLRQEWSEIARKFGVPPKQLAGSTALYRNTMVDISTRLVTATIMVDSGRPTIAADSLRAVRDALSDLRKANGVYLLADCARDVRTATDRLTAFRDGAPDRSQTDFVDGFAGIAETYRALLNRCEGAAGASVRTEPEFRRIVDGAATTLGFMIVAVESRDREALRRAIHQMHEYSDILILKYE